MIQTSMQRNNEERFTAVSANPDFARAGNDDTRDTLLSVVHLPDYIFGAEGGPIQLSSRRYNFHWRVDGATNPLM